MKVNNTPQCQVMAYFTADLIPSEMSTKRHLIQCLNHYFNFSRSGVTNKLQLHSATLRSYETGTKSRLWGVYLFLENRKNEKYWANAQVRTSWARMSKDNWKAKRGCTQLVFFHVDWAKEKLLAVSPLIFQISSKITEISYGNDLFAEAIGPYTLSCLN